LDDQVTLDPNDLTLTLPLVTVLQVAIVDLLFSWNIKPRCVVGHSSGEIAAAYASGKLGRRAAWKTAYVRGVVAAKLSGKKGGMLAVALSPTRAKEFIRDYESAGKLAIACYNSPSNQTISGDVDAIDALKATLEKEGIFAHKLNVFNAYHSSHMLAGAEEYTALLGDLRSDDKIPGWSDISMISSVTGLPLTSKQLELPSYWTNNLTSPVQFTSALLVMCEKSGVAFDDLIEIGPHSTLRSAINETLQDSISGGHSYHPTMKRKEASATPILTTAGSLWCRGYPVRLDVVNEVEPMSARLLIDLPPYKFNHETSFLLESRLSSNYRFRQYPRMDLVGAPVPDWDPDHPKWRHFFRVKEVPWAAEHKITGQIISAGAGWIIMAIEGVKQLADPALKIAGFRLREVALQSTLIIPETDEGVEVMMSMRWMPETSETTSKTWREFTITSCDQDSKSWRIHARGLISVEYEQHATSIDNDRKQHADDEAAKRQLAYANNTCRTPVDSEWVYGMFKAAGFDFKRRYKNLSDILINDGPDLFNVVGVVRNPDLTPVTAAGYVYPHTFHTVALDSVLHMGLPTILARQKDGSVPSATIPSWFDEVWISSDISSRVGDGLRLCLNQYNDFWYGLRNDIIGFDEQTSERRLHIKGLKYHTLQSRQLSSTTLEPCHQIKWEPDVDLIRTDYFASQNAASIEVKEAAARLQRECEASVLELTKTIDLGLTNEANFPSHVRYYLAWLQSQRKALERERSSFLDPLTASGPPTNSSAIDGLTAHRIQLVQAVRKQLISLLKGDADPSTILIDERSDLQSAIRECYDNGNLPKLLTSYLKLLRHKRGSLKILEVGAGRGIVTRTVLEELAPQGDGNSHSTSFVSQYDFTDTTDGFFNDAREDLGLKGQTIQYKKFDVESDPASKVLETGPYDLIIAANVFHSMIDPSATLKKLHACLNPGGKLLLLEHTEQSTLWLPLIYGVCPNWWRGNGTRNGDKRLLGNEGWDCILRQTGFAGTEVILKDSNDKACTMSIMVSTAISSMNGNDLASRAPNLLVVNMLSQSQSEFCQVIAARIAKAVGSDQLPVRALDTIKGLDISDVTCIVLSDGEDMSLTELDDKIFDSLKHLVTTCSRIFWISTEISQPHSAMANGFLRTARWERGGADTDLSLLNIMRSSDDEHDIAHAVKLLHYHFFSGRAIRNAEYGLRNGMIWTNRISEFQEVNDFREKHTFSGSKITLSPFRSKAGRSLKLNSQTPGRLETLHFVDDPDAKAPLGADEVEVQVAAAGLNFRDVVVALGEQHQDVYGLEGSGWATRVGSDVKNIKVGDRVVGLWNRGRGFMRSVCKVHHAMVTKIPENMSFETAAAIPINLTTVIYSLRELAHLSHEDKILIHSGAGGTGQAAIQYAQMVGAEIFTTVSTEEKKQYLIDTYGIPADHIFSSRTLDFASLILDATGGQGVDVVLNSLAGEALRRSLDCVAPLGRFIELGKKDIYANGRLQMKAFRKSITFFAVDVLSVFERREVYSGQLLKEAIELVNQGMIAVSGPLETYSFAELLPAFRKLQTGNVMGKIVFRVSDDDLVPVRSPKMFDIRT
jgi:NADPH:quinone reductase-like Zn-dependent oxidoreductase/acyl transferase domain-containing protein